MLDKISPSQRAGVDGHSAAAKVKDYLVDKDASHVIPYSKGGSSHSHNIKWESKATNRARGNQLMTRQEQMRLGTKVHFDNFTGALQTGLGAVPKGAVIGIVTTVPFSTLRNTLRGARGEISPHIASESNSRNIQRECNWHGSLCYNCLCSHHSCSRFSACCYSTNSNLSCFVSCRWRGNGLRVVQDC